MDAFNKEKIIEYIKKSKIITLPTIQKQFALPYDQAKILFAELVEKGVLSFSSGITYNVRAEESGNSFRSDGGVFDPIDPIDDIDDDDEEYVEDDEAFEAFEEEAYEKLLEALREEEEEDGDNDEDDGEEAFNRLGNFGKLCNLKRIFNECISRQIKNETAGGVSCNVITIGGEQFKLEYDDRSLRITYENFAPADCVSAMRADTIIQEYKSLHYNAGAIEATVEDMADSLDALLELYAAVIRIKNGD